VKNVDEASLEIISTGRTRGEITCGELVFRYVCGDPLRNRSTFKLSHYHLSTHQDWYGVNMRSESHLLFGCNTLLELVTCFPFTDFYRSQWPASCLLLLRNSQKAPHFRQITGNLSHQPILKLSLFLLLHQSLLIHIRRMHQSSQKSRMRQ